MENEEKEQSLPANSSSPEDPYRMLYVLLVVLILCGGNGLGILTGAILWKLTGAVTAAVLVAVTITLIAFACAMVVIVLHNRKK